jgi:hypothetical protein
MDENNAQKSAYLTSQILLFWFGQHPSYDKRKVQAMEELGLFG